MSDFVLVVGLYYRDPPYLPVIYQCSHHMPMPPSACCPAQCFKQFHASHPTILRIISDNSPHHIRQFAASYPPHAFRQFPASYQHYAFRHFSVLNSLQKNDGGLFIRHIPMKSPPKILISSINSCHLTDFSLPPGKRFKCNNLSPSL